MPKWRASGRGVDGGYTGFVRTIPGLVNRPFWAHGVRCRSLPSQQGLLVTVSAYPVTRIPHVRPARYGGLGFDAPDGSKKAGNNPARPRVRAASKKTKKLGSTANSGLPPKLIFECTERKKKSVNLQAPL